jgi:hypothetical protein
VAESAPHQEPDLRKRRSSRIVQAVPLTVTGVDALGRPFQERTSTLIINCHGCRYQSKHYVLKNMWITMEVPHPDTGRDPRVVRGRVTWIQRPRTVRELFQIGIELEIPGNIWGIAFPPADWFPAPENLGATVPAPDAEAPLDAAAAEFGTPGVTSETDNVVVMGAGTSAAGGADVSLQLARQVARLMVEAKQQIQTAVRDAAAKSVSKETQHLLTAVGSQLEEAAKKAVASAADEHTRQLLEKTAERIEQHAKASTETLRGELNREVDARIEEAQALIAARIAGIEQTEQQHFQEALGAGVNAAIDRLKQSAEAAAARAEQAREQFEASRQQLRVAVEEATRRWDEVLSGRTSDAAIQMEKFRTAADGLSNQIREAMERSEQSWRARMATDLEAAQKRAAEVSSNSLEDAVQAAKARIAEQTDTELNRVRGQVDEQMNSMRRQAEDLHAQASQTLGDFRSQLAEELARRDASFAEIRAATGRAMDQARQVESLHQSAAARLEQRINEWLEAATLELNARSERAVVGMAERLQPLLDAAGAQSVARLGEQLEQELTPQIDRAKDLIEKLQTNHTSAEEVLRAQQDRLWQASEQFVQEASARVRESTGRAENAWQESSRATMAKWNEDLESRATEVTHTTIESLFKSATWYEKKVQTQMQSALDKGLEQSGETLRARAGEMSALFASELDHYSRSFVEHAKGQLGESAREAAEQMKQKIREAVDSGGQEVGSVARKAAQTELERFTAGLRNSFDESAAHVEAHAVQVRARMGGETRQFLADFQRNLAQKTQEALEAAGKEQEAQSSAFRESARAELVEQEKAFKSGLALSMSDALGTYKSRMENASNAWILTTAVKLNNDAEKQIEDMARKAEAKLRDTFSKVFAGVGDALRDRLLDFSASVQKPPAPPSGSDPEKT